MRLAVAAGWQAERKAECLELFQLAGFQISGRQWLAGDGIGLRLSGLGLLDFYFPNDGRSTLHHGRDRLLRLLLDNFRRTLNSVRRNHHRRRWMQQLHGAVSGLRQFRGIGCCGVT